jgi:DMSO/TMAO reductase YedYZ molybdopterin-dependent catalytic subunit
MAKLSRREFLKQTGMLLGGTALGSIVFSNSCANPATSSGTTVPSTTTSQIPGVIYSPDTLRTDRIPPGQHQVTAWPQVQAGATPVINMANWSFTVSGLVEKELTLTFAEFTALPAVKVLSDIHCVTTWTRLDNLWDGYGAKIVANLAKPKSQAKFVIVSAVGGFTSNFTIEDFLQDDVLFATKHDGVTLPADHGGPLRLVVPRLYFWKSAKWVTGIKFTDQDQPGFWEKLGYNNHGDPWLEERYS